MKKSTTLKMTLFFLLSDLICILGNIILDFEPMAYVTQGLFFATYLFLMIWICQLIYGRTRFGINILILFLSFTLGLFCSGMVALGISGILFEYYVLFFYLFVIVCVISSIVLVGRLIFSSSVSEDATQESADDCNQNC